MPADQVPATTTRGLRWSVHKEPTIGSLSPVSMRRQVAPPVVEAKAPPSPKGPWNPEPTPDPV